MIQQDDMADFSTDMYAKLQIILESLLNQARKQAERHAEQLLQLKAVIKSQEIEFQKLKKTIQVCQKQILQQKSNEQERKKQFPKKKISLHKLQSFNKSNSGILLHYVTQLNPANQVIYEHEKHNQSINKLFPLLSTFPKIVSEFSNTFKQKEKPQFRRQQILVKLSHDMFQSSGKNLGKNKRNNLNGEEEECEPISKVKQVFQKNTKQKPIRSLLTEKQSNQRIVSLSHGEKTLHGNKTLRKTVILKLKQVVSNNFRGKQNKAVSMIEDNNKSQSIIPVKKIMLMSHYTLK